MSDRREWPDMGGLVPSVNDLSAGMLLTVVYMIRLETVANPAVSAPWWLTLTTDMLLPLLAGMWLWAAATLTVYRRTSAVSS